MKGSSQSGFVPVENKKGASISDKKRVKETWAERFDNVLNRDIFARKDTEQKKKVCDILDVKKVLFCEEQLVTVLKELKNNKTPSFLW